MFAEGDEEREQVIVRLDPRCLPALGVLTLPIALLTLAWNEQRLFCSKRPMLQLAKMAVQVSCNDTKRRPGQPVFFSCPLDPSSFWEFTPAELNFGMRREGLGTAVSIKSPAVGQKAWMYQCVETGIIEGGISVHSYHPAWVSHMINTSFYAQHEEAVRARERECPGLDAAVPRMMWPKNLESELSISHAKHVRAGSFTLLTPLIIGCQSDQCTFGVGLQPDMSKPVVLNASAARLASLEELPLEPPEGGLEVLNLQNTAVSPDGLSLITCRPGKDAFGCIKIQYFENTASHVSVLTGTGAGGNTEAVLLRSLWECGETKMEALEPQALTEEEFVALALPHVGTFSWLLRALAFTLASLSVYFFQLAMRGTRGGEPTRKELHEAYGRLPPGLRVAPMHREGPSAAKTVARLCIAIPTGLAFVLAVLSTIWMPLYVENSMIGAVVAGGLLLWASSILILTKGKRDSAQSFQMGSGQAVQESHRALEVDFSSSDESW